jgi:hypothetical protein
MRFFTFLIGFFVFIYTLSIGNYVYADNFLSEEEKTSIRDRIVSEQLKINNLYVKFNLIITKDNGEPPLQHMYEWAMSGEKQYRKRYFSTPVGEPLSERFGLAVWDGKFLKAYDSLINNGSIRNKYDSKDPRQPKTTCPYTRLLGSLDEGLISKMLTTTPLGNWKAEWMDNGTNVVFRYKIPGHEREWTFDLEKNCMITKYVSIIKSFDGKIASDLKVTVSESQEVKPGIWLPTKSNTHAVFYYPDQTMIRDNDIIVEEIKSNEPDIEESFHFEFPEGSQYYDYVIGQTIIPYLSEKGLRQELDKTIDDIIEMKDEEKSINSIPPSKPAKITENTKLKEKDDFEIVGLIQEEIGPNSKQMKSTKSLFQQFRWFWFALLIASLFVVVALYRGFVLRRRNDAKNKCGISFKEKV